MVINVAYARFKADKDSMDALVYLQHQTEGSKPWKASPGEVTFGHGLR